MSEFDDKRSQNDGQDEQSGSVYSYSYSDINHPSSSSFLLL